MNEFLAELYNTRESIGAGQSVSDVEKLAEAQLLDEALRAENINIDQLPGETILKLAYELFGEDSALVKSAAEEGETEAHEEEESKEHEEGEKEETMEEKAAQADFLGRVMAHSYWNEKTAIEKQAASLAELGAKAKDLGTKALAAVKNAPGAIKAKPGAMRESYKKGLTTHLKHSPGEGMVEVAHAPSKMRGLARVAKEHKGTVGAAGLAALGLTGAGAYGAHKALKGKKKESSAIDALAEKRAMEWAAAHGLIEQPEEVKLAAAVNQRAYEMLVNAGIDVDAIEAG